MIRASMMLVTCGALAGCSKHAPAPQPPGAAGAGARAAPGTPPGAGPAATVAPPAPDAALAGAPDAKVLVPGSLADDADAGGDPLDALARAIDKEVTSARGKRPAGRVVVYADTTLDYGCLCPPFVFAPFYNSGRPDSYVLPIFARGVPDASPSKMGVFRLAGHFDGRRMTGFDWLKLRGGKVEEEGMDEYAHEAPVFVVDGWCFEPVDAFPDASAEESYGPTLREMAQRGRFCPGARFPGPASRGAD